MSTLEARGARAIPLRPEFTAGVVRAVLQHSLHRLGELPVKVWAVGPAFRYERAQAGRYRQFYQVDLEAIRSPGPTVHTETIAIASDFYHSPTLTQLPMDLNSRRCKKSR